MQVLSGFIRMCILTFLYLTLQKYVKPTVNSSYFLGKIMGQILWYYFMYCFYSQKNHQCRNLCEQGVGRGQGHRCWHLQEKSCPCSCHLALASLPCQTCSSALPRAYSSSFLCPQPPQKPDSLTAVMLQTKAVQGTVVWRAGSLTVLCMCCLVVSRAQEPLGAVRRLRLLPEPLAVLEGEPPAALELTCRCRNPNCKPKSSYGVQGRTQAAGAYLTPADPLCTQKPKCPVWVPFLLPPQWLLLQTHVFLVHSLFIVIISKSPSDPRNFNFFFLKVCLFV